MSIQSLSIVVPGKKCINNCKFCVSNSHKDIVYEDRISENLSVDNSKTFTEERYKTALRYAKDLGCTTLMLTGECEPQQNMPFLRRFLSSLIKVGPSADTGNIFNNIEIQTTGRGLDKEAIHELAIRGVNTFSISVSSFDDHMNAAIINQGKEIIPLKELCRNIKEEGCLLRLSINLSDFIVDLYTPEELFRKCKEEYKADQVTLRKLYLPEKRCSQSEWIAQHTDVEKDKKFFEYIKKKGTRLETLPYGLVKYSVNGVGTVADDDCMAKKNGYKPAEDIRYLILRPDCHLYTRWDDPASIIY